MINVTLAVLRSLPRVSQDLTPEDLRRRVYGGRQHWLLDFYTPWCVPCQQFAPEFELLAHVRACPTIPLLTCAVFNGRVACESVGLDAVAVFGRSWVYIPGLAE